VADGIHRPGTPCKLGHVEYDYARYCYEHGGFVEAGQDLQGVCDRREVLSRTEGSKAVSGGA
jgi:hypothetical protein